MQLKYTPATSCNDNVPLEIIVCAKILYFVAVLCKQYIEQMYFNHFMGISIDSKAIYFIFLHSNLYQQLFTLNKAIHMLKHKKAAEIMMNLQH